jgi:hypothetical protein
VPSGPGVSPDRGPEGIRKTPQNNFKTSPKSFWRVSRAVGSRSVPRTGIRKTTQNDFKTSNPAMT